MTFPKSYLTPQEYRSLQVELLNRQKRIVIRSGWDEYITNPVAWVKDFVEFPEGAGTTDYQDDALIYLEKDHRLTMRGPHGLGKTFVAALAILWFLSTRPWDTKIPCMASSWRQVEKYLWPEVRKWYLKTDWDKWESMGGLRPRLYARSMKIGGTEALEGTAEAFIMSSDNEALIEGAHADNMLYIFDECKTIPPATWDAAEGAFASGDCYWLAISTPGPPNTRFYDIHKRAPGFEDWTVRHITLKQAIDAGRIREEWADARKRQWGEDSAVYKNRVLGEFASSDEDSVISLEAIERANTRWLDWQEKEFPGEFVGVGVDVGAGGDPTVYALRFDHRTVEEELRGIKELRRDNKRNTMAVVGKISGILNVFEGYAIIDVIGIGAGVVHRMRELLKPKDKETDPDESYMVKSFNASEKTTMRDSSGELGFYNKRAAAWWNVRELLNDDLLALPPDDKLTGDLTAPSWDTRSGGRIIIEAKKKIKKEIKRSTDDGDAVVMAFFEGILSAADMVDFA